MQFQLFLFLFIPYLIGLVFGFTYLIFFVDKEVKNKFYDRNQNLGYLGLGGLVISVFFSFFHVLLFEDPFYSLSLISSSWIFYFFLAIICFSKSLHSFGIIKIHKVKSIKPNKNNFILELKNNGRLFLNSHFLLLSGVSVILALVYFPKPIVVLITFWGIYTSLLFSLLMSRNIRQ